MGASFGGGDASMDDLLVRHGPRVLQHLFGDAASPESAPEHACPPRLLQIVGDAVHEVKENGWAGAPAAAVPSLDKIMYDPDYRRMEKAMPGVMDRVREGLRAGRPAAEMRVEISDLVIEHLRNVVTGSALEGMRQSLLCGDLHEQEIGLAAINALAAEHLAAGLVDGGAPVNGAGGAGKQQLAGHIQANLIRDALFSAAAVPVPLVVKIVRGMADATSGYAHTQGTAEKNELEIAIMCAVARAVARVCAPAVPRGPRSLCEPGRQGQGGYPLVDGISREIALLLAGGHANASHRS